MHRDQQSMTSKDIDGNVNGLSLDWSRDPHQEVNIGKRMLGSRSWMLMQLLVLTSELLNQHFFAQSLR